MGFVVDFGWKRSEEGMEWEVEEWRRSAVKARRQEEERKLVGTADHDRGRMEGIWESVPFLGSW